MPTIVYGDFEWDPAKAASNLETHGVSFEEAASALVDPLAYFFTNNDPDAERVVAIGMSEHARVLFVVHVERGPRDRIISARIATRNEESIYAQG